MAQPQIFSAENKLPEGVHHIDALTVSLEELFYIDNPTVDKRDPASHEARAQYVAMMQEEIAPLWVFYPDENIVVKNLPEELYFKLRTARNRHLIRTEEQQRYRDIKVGIAGLSVGSAVFGALVQTGGPKRIKIADPDTVEVSNLNRMQANLLDVGKNKTTVAADRAWKLDPFAEFELWETGIAKETLGNFVEGVDIFIDEMDAIPLKIASRVECREKGIPVIMATDNGDSVIIDIERFDLEPEREIFHGQVTKDEYDFAPKSSKEFVEMANKIIDPTFFTKRQLESVTQIGETLSGIAQLGTAVAIAGATMAFVVRGLANDYKLPSGRYVIGCEDTFKLTLA